MGRRPSLWLGLPILRGVVNVDHGLTSSRSELAPGTQNEPGGAPDRIDSWKEIAAHLHRTVRTVQRWERCEGLPVHRHRHTGGDTVYAYRSELEAWRRQRESGPLATQDDAGDRRPLPRRLPWLLAAAAVALLIVAATTARWYGPALADRVEGFWARPSAGNGEVTAAREDAPAEPRIWRFLAPADERPSGRWMASAIYDSTQGRIVLFGGYDTEFRNDVWVLTGAGGGGMHPRWRHLDPAGIRPPPRGEHTAVYDRSDGRMIVFGGRDQSGWLNDVWMLADATAARGEPQWIELRPEGPLPPVRHEHSAVYDGDGDRMIVYGGAAADLGKFFDDVWVLEDTRGLGGGPRWRQLRPASRGPGGRRDHTATYHAGSRRMTVVGGYDEPPGRPATSAIWVLEMEGPGGAPRWIPLEIEGPAPTPREGHSAGYDPERDRLWAAFGTPGRYRLDDVWTLSDASGARGPSRWVLQAAPAPGPAPRNEAAAVFDEVAERLLVFGGLGDKAAPLDDLWVMVPAAEIEETIVDSFDTAKLDDAWQVLHGPGSVSLMESPGRLRYRVAAAGRGGGMRLARQFRGDHWTLEAPVRYFTGPSGGNRVLFLCVLFGTVPSEQTLPPSAVCVLRQRDDWTGRQPGALIAGFSPAGETFADSTAVPVDDGAPHIWRFRREGRDLTIALARGKDAFRDVMTHRLSPELASASQFLVIGGNSFANFDSYMEVDSVRLSETDGH